VLRELPQKAREERPQGGPQRVGKRLKKTSEEVPCDAEENCRSVYVGIEAAKRVVAAEELTHQKCVGRLNQSHSSWRRACIKGSVGSVHEQFENTASCKPSASQEAI
jgi:hypothetical protein